MSCGRHPQWIHESSDCPMCAEFRAAERSRKAKAEATLQQIREYVGVVKAQAADAADAAKDARQRREVGTANYYEGKEEAYDDCATEIAALLVAPTTGETR